MIPQLCIKLNYFHAMCKTIIHENFDTTLYLWSLHDPLITHNSKPTCITLMCNSTINTEHENQTLSKWHLIPQSNTYNNEAQSHKQVPNKKLQL